MEDEGNTLTEAQRASAKTPVLAPYLELALECERPLAGPARYCLSDVHEVRVGRGPNRFARVRIGGVIEIMVPDGWMSSRHAELRPGTGGWNLVDLGSKNGTLVNGTQTSASRIHDGDLLQLGHTLFRFRGGLPVDGPTLLDAGDLPSGPAGMATLSHAFAEVVTRATAIAAARVPVLLRGDTGTGKEVLARAIHTMSGRSGAFIAVNCGAIPDDLVESELFGHRKGAFSGANQDQLGFVRASDGGTLFLDEVGDLPLAAQAALLRVLQESEVVPVGQPRPVRVNLRVVAATHRDLDALVANFGFRRDLLARLDGVTLFVPALRDRSEDVPLLIASLIRRLAPERSDAKLAPDAAQALLEHDWPLNVRELEQALAGALALSGMGAIERVHLPRALHAEPREDPERELTADEQRHRDELISLLVAHRGNLSAVSRAVGKGRNQVVRWMARYRLDADKYRAG